MSAKSTSLGLAAALVALAGLAGQANAGAHCNTNMGGARYSAPKVAAAKPAPAVVATPRVAQASKPQVSAAPQAGVDPEIKATIVATPVASQQNAAADKLSASDAASETTSVAGIAARLAALAAQQGARNRGNAVE